MVYHDPVIPGLLNISKDYYEAATVDGATGLQQFWYITLPSLKNILFFCSVTLTVDMWKLFNESYILPGPGTSNTPCSSTCMSLVSMYLTWDMHLLLG